MARPRQPTIDDTPNVLLHRGIDRRNYFQKPSVYLFDARYGRFSKQYPDIA